MAAAYGDSITNLFKWTYLYESPRDRNVNWNDSHRITPSYYAPQGAPSHGESRGNGTSKIKVFYCLRGWTYLSRLKTHSVLFSVSFISPPRTCLCLFVCVRMCMYERFYVTPHSELAVDFFFYIVTCPLYYVDLSTSVVVAIFVD